MTRLPNKCVQRHAEPEFSVYEQQSRVIFHNPHLRAIQQIKVDGCVFKDNDGKKCDHLVNVAETNISVLVELKGSDIDEAFQQLNQAQERLAEHVNRRIFWIICYSGSPRHTTEIANMRKMARLHKKADLRVEATVYTHLL